MNTDEMKGGRMLLYTKPQHGSLPVRVLRRGSQRTFKVTHPGGRVVEYPNTRQLLIALYGHDTRQTFDRYFRRGRYAPQVDPGLPLLRLFGAVGVNLKARGEEVAKLFYRACGASLLAYGYDPQEVLQEVYKGILARNKGACPWDPQQSSFGTYVTMVAQCVFRNYHKREQRRRRREQVGTPGYQGGERVYTDAALTAHVDHQASLGLKVQDLLSYLRQRHDWHYAEAKLAREILPLVVQGKKRGEIAAEIGTSGPLVGRALTHLRRATQEWLTA
jgi:DNA-directed RNA polymerase specialized sigma24 family protein